MRRLIGPTIVVTLLGLASQAISFAIQIVMASVFGSRAEMDAYLAAITLPTYLTTVLFGSVSYALIPAIIKTRENHGERRARELAGSAVALYVVVALGLALAGGVLARPLLQLLIGDLPDRTLDVAVRVSWIAWPSALLGGGALLLTAICHARERFRWPALAPVLGGFVNLVIVATVAKQLGAAGLAVATLCGSAAQVVLVMAFARSEVSGHQLRNADLFNVLVLMRPLVASGLVGQAYAPVERHLASELGAGTIPQIGYAGRLNMALASLVSGGIAVTLFPTMSRFSAANDHARLRDSVGLGLRITWTLVAPLVAIGSVLAYPLIHALLQRGAFTSVDTAAVAAILPGYLVSLIGLAQANVTSRALYALNRTAAVLRIAIIETIVYLVAGVALTRWLGVYGLVAAWAVSANLSFAMQAWVLRAELGSDSIARIVVVVGRVAIAAAGAAAIAWVIASHVAGPVVVIVALSGVAGLVMYAFLLIVLRAPEIAKVIELVRTRSR